MLDKIDENRQQGAKPNSVKVRIFRGNNVDAMKDFPNPYLKRSTTNTILHVGPNNSINDSSNVTLNKLLSLKNFIHPESNVIFSNMIDMSENAIAKLKIQTLTNTLILTIVIFHQSTCIVPIFLNRHGKD